MGHRCDLFAQCDPLAEPLSILDHGPFDEFAQGATGFPRPITVFSDQASGNPQRRLLFRETSITCLAERPTKSGTLGIFMFWLTVGKGRLQRSIALLGNVRASVYFLQRSRDQIAKNAVYALESFSGHAMSVLSRSAISA